MPQVFGGVAEALFVPAVPGDEREAADRPTDRQTDRPTDRQTDRPTDRQTDRRANHTNHSFVQILIMVDLWTRKIKEGVTAA